MPRGARPRPSRSRSPSPSRPDCFLFSEGGNVTHLIASLKTISEDGGFEIKNSDARKGETLPVLLKLGTIIDRELFHRAPGRIPSDYVIEFS